MKKFSILFLLFSFSFLISAQERGIFHVKTGENLSKFQDKFYSDNQTLFGDNEVFELTIISDFRKLAKETLIPQLWHLKLVLFLT